MTDDTNTDDSPETIVAEVTCNWPKPWPVPRCEHISAKFEAVIAHNKARGYVLQSWQFKQLMISAEEMSETIIAVFERVPA